MSYRGRKLSDLSAIPGVAADANRYWRLAQCHPAAEPMSSLFDEIAVGIENLDTLVFAITDFNSISVIRRHAWGGRLRILGRTFPGLYVVAIVVELGYPH